MSVAKTGVGIVGCGNIAGKYAADLAAYPEIDLVGVTDLDRGRAEALATEHGGKVYDDLDAMLADDAIEIVVDLAIHHAHYDLNKRCLLAGKHVHSEKPLALTVEEARDLCRTAEERGVRLGASPFTWMGEAQQTAWKLIRDGMLGDVKLCYAEVNHGRIEAWHPNPEPFYEVGAFFDVGVYPLTILTTFFGPARRVTAVGKTLYPDRTTKEGRAFHIDAPDCVIAILELERCPLVRLTANFYVRDTTQKGIEFHGDKGSLHLGSFQGFNASVAYAPFGEGLQEVPLIGEPYKGTEWGRGVRNLAAAIREGRPHGATGAQAAHVVEILNAAMASSATGRPVDISSSFPLPEPMEVKGSDECGVMSDE